MSVQKKSLISQRSAVKSAILATPTQSGNMSARPAVQPAARPKVQAAARPKVQAAARPKVQAAVSTKVRTL
jgi:hypothetical protein